MTALPFEALVERVRRSAEDVHRRIEAAGGDPAVVRVLAVTKGQPAAAVRAAIEAGLIELGESYVQELTAKADELEAVPGGAEPRWHLIGRLQRNKVRAAAPYVDLWQTVDGLSLAAEVARRAPGAEVLVQVNVTGAPQQGGCAPDRVAAVVEGCGDVGLDVRGLMAIGPQGADHDVRAGFRLLRDLADRLGLAERSMGMSGDLEAAVAEGSTMVRIGTALFGPRTGPGVVGK
ncbi:MAG: YggS family pyridoxal phosphate-dependent enzyme [Acidimicrobiales bacterium]